jgi:hypothetical protein
MQFMSKSLFLKWQVGVVEITLSRNTVVSTTVFIFIGCLRYKVPPDELNFVIFTTFSMCWDSWGDDETPKFQQYNAKFDYKSFDIFHV